MKMDMSGAAAVLSSMSTLSALGCPTAVTGYLMCTDNMPSGSAMKLGDVLTIHGGTTVEIHNTDAEGRLVLADGLALATEEQPDAIVDIATLTGACMVALGTAMAGVLGNDQPWVDQVEPRRRAPPTSRCGSCRWRRSATASCSTPTSPTSRTSAGPTAGRSRPPCSCPSSSATCRGPTSTSPGR